DVRKTAGMVFQNPDNQIVATVVEEDVAFACENMGLPPEEIRKRVDECLAAVGMSEYAKHAPHLLSGGQKQRVALAGVLAMRPRCIVMDEPTAMLDPSGRAEVIRAVQKLNRETGMTVVLITHHMEEAALADRVIVMKQGKVALDGTPKQVFSQVDRLRELSLTAPQTVQLLYELDPTGEALSPEALSVEECADQLMKYLEA
ncbi:MAG: ATP-binding cassette domain-containing protein, partial [Clostridia bacterium]|nr:ATP-binding cassette domain-containing protein [Clostridia bacterium]